MHPYQTLDEQFFWATAVAQRSMFDIDRLWEPKFNIGKQAKVVTFGSCFAQHIGQALRSRGFNWHIAEPGPAGLSPQNAKKYNYGLFSARTGNIYTVSLLEQWVNWATGIRPMPNEIWQRDGRFYDPFRPNVEPNGFTSENELLASREAVLEAFKECILESRVFIFTLGLTESWINSKSGDEYPMCPGTVAGEFDGVRHRFVNQTFPFIRKTLSEVVVRIRELNPKIKFLLTVSPVPLTATMSGRHVLVATMESKSILRAVAGSIRDEFKDVDYFPSYEIINAPPFKGAFFEPNQRNVNHVGVAHVMNMFFTCLETTFSHEASQVKPSPGLATSRSHQHLAKISTPGGGQENQPANPENDVVCEEAILEAFSEKESL